MYSARMQISARMEVVASCCIWISSYDVSYFVYSIPLKVNTCDSNVIISVWLPTLRLNIALLYS